MALSKDEATNFRRNVHARLAFFQEAIDVIIRQEYVEECCVYIDFREIGTISLKEQADLIDLYKTAGWNVQRVEDQMLGRDIIKLFQKAFMCTSPVRTGFDFKSQIMKAACFIGVNTYL